MDVDLVTCKWLIQRISYVTNKLFVKQQFFFCLLLINQSIASISFVDKKAFFGICYFLSHTFERQF